MIPAETFAPLARLAGFAHAFTLRTAADTKADSYRATVARAFGVAGFAEAEQPHGNGVAVVTQPAARVPGVDALITSTPDLWLFIRCADCAPVYIVDPVQRAIGLIHSGKKGTALNVAGATLAALQREFGVRPADCVVVIGPSIGPCHYDLDLWTPLEQQLHSAGVRHVYNERRCTACQLDRYYSYRAERGQTGRHYGLLAVKPRTTLIRT